MKRTIIYTILSTFILLACRKSDNPKLPDLIRVPTPIVALDPSSDAFINPGNPASFYGKVIVDLKFKSDIPPQKLDLVVMKNSDESNVKTLKADITSFPTSVDFTGQQFITLFGAPIADGDRFDVGVDITTKDGKKYLAFPPGGVPYGTGVANEAGGVSTSVTFIKPCSFVASAYSGDFVVLADEWVDYQPGEVIPVTVLSPTQIAFMYNVDPGSAKPIKMTIDPTDNSISVVRQEYGSYGGTKVYAESVAGSVNPCDLSLSVTLKHTLANGTDLGNYTIQLKKQ